MGSRCVKLGVIALTLSYWSLEVQHGTSWQRTLWGSEKKEFGKKKIAMTLKLSCKTIRRFNMTGSIQNRPRHGQPKKLSARAQHHIQRLCLGNRHMSATSIAAEVEGVGGSACQCSDHTPHTASNWSAWLSSQKEASSKDDTEESPQTLDYWNHVLWSDETKINLFGSDGVKHVWW